MKKSLKISILLIILFIILTFTFIKLIHYPYSEQEQNDLKLEEIKNSTLKYNDDPIVYESKSEKVKGIIQNIQLNGAVINLTNSYFFSETLGSYKEGNSLDEYNILNLHLAENTHILNYIDSSEIRFEDIDIGDILIYDGNIEYIAQNERRISSGNILILKRTDLNRITMEQYKGMTELKDVNIVYEYNSSDLPNTTFLYGKLHVKFRDNEFIDFFKMEISNDTIIENDSSKNYADIILKNNFEDMVVNKTGDREKNIHEVKQIIYK
jgi:hypothetical protein